MSFPTIVYRCPGDHQRPGGTYSYRGVADDEQLEAALTDGWFVTLGEAIDGKSSAIETDPAEPESNAPPTRKELEQQAKELDISFNARTSDEKLLERINEALGG